MTTLNQDRDAQKNPHSSFHDSKVCPRCGANKIQRSKSITSDGFLRSFFYKFYRCRICNFRFRKIKASGVVALTSLFIVIVSIAGAYWYTSSQANSSVNTTEIFAFKQVNENALKGDSYAELQMGLRYAEADGVLKNDKEAVNWFEKAAQHNQTEAQYRFGLALLQGTGIVQNYQAAFYWIEKAALRGHSQAQLSLGEIYRKGIGIKENKEKAYLWFNLAAASGLEKAAFPRDQLAKQLQPNQITAMQQEAQRINAQHSTNLEQESKTDAKKSVSAP